MFCTSMKKYFVCNAIFRMNRYNYTQHTLLMTTYVYYKMFLVFPYSIFSFLLLVI